MVGTLKHYFAPHYSCFGGCLLWAPNNWRFNAIRSSISKVCKSFLYFEVETDAADNTPWIFIQSWNNRHDGRPNDRKQYESRDSETIKLNKYPRHLSFACVFAYVYLCRWLRCCVFFSISTSSSFLVVSNLLSLTHICQSFILSIESCLRVGWITNNKKTAPTLYLFVRLVKFNWVLFFIRNMLFQI